MSHVTMGEVLIDDLSALGDAAFELGKGQLLKASTYRWYGFSVGDYPLPPGMKASDLGKCEYAIKFPGIDYEVGVVRRKDGKYALLYDFYGNRRYNYANTTMGGVHDGEQLRDMVGAGCGKLAQLYGIHRQIGVARKKGQMVTRKVKPNGTIQLICQ